MIYLKEAEDGLKFRLETDLEKNNIKIEEYEKRLSHEINIICKMNYASYFLIVSDYIKWAKKIYQLDQVEAQVLAH